MTEIEKISEKMGERGVSVELLSEMANIPVEMLKDKLHGRVEFLASEIYAIGINLRLEPDEVYKIFLKNK